MRVRAFCHMHEQPLINVGSGRMVYPTDGDPEPNEDGWFELDMSELTCERSEMDECDETWGWQIERSVSPDKPEDDLNPHGYWEAGDYS